MKEKKRTKLPPLYHMCKGYQLMVFFNTKNAYGMGEGWMPLSSTSGHPWTYKGFAINRAKAMGQWGYGYRDAYFQVVELQTGEIVWQSENVKSLEVRNFQIEINSLRKQVFHMDTHQQVLERHTGNNVHCVLCLEWNKWTLSQRTATRSTYQNEEEEMAIINHQPIIEK